MKILIKFIFCGIFSGLLFPPFFILPIGFIIFPYIYFLLIQKEFQNQKKIFHFFSGLAYGIGLNLVVLIWIKEPFLVDQSTRHITLVSYLLVIYCAIYYGISFLILSFFKNNFSKLIFIPIIFVISEILRENIGYGFPWITFALINSDNILILNLIYYLGNYGLSYFTIFIFLTPSIIILIYKKNTFKIVINTYISTSLIIFLLSIILVLIRYKDTSDIENKLLNVTLVQLNLSLSDKINNFDSEKKLQQIKQIKQIIDQNNSDLLIFSENDYPYLISDLKDLTFLTSNLKDNNSIIIGGTKKEKSKFFNTLILLEKNIIKNFDKKILVPFGEFLPFRNYLFFLDNIVGGSDFSSGNNIRFIKTSDNLKILPIICYEIIFFNDLLNQENINSELLINITNDAWFGDLSGPYQHFYLSRMRAVEFNKPLIRVSNNGISAIIDNKGQIIDYISLNERALIHSSILIPNSMINLTHYHFLILVLLFIFSIIAIIVNQNINDRTIS